MSLTGSKIQHRLEICYQTFWCKSKGGS